MSSDIEWIVQEALKTIPAQSEFYKCISGVMLDYKKFPGDWKRTWLEVQRNWADDIGCPDGVFAPFNIDAKVNAAYVVIGLLYGKGDYTNTLEITTRCGQDADCNPSSAGGILGTILGYEKIPAYWKMGLKEAESIKFKYTSMSLNDVYETGLKHALQSIESEGGKLSGDMVQIRVQSPKAVAMEKSFPGLYPIEKKKVDWNSATHEANFDFDGTGFVLRGQTASWASTSSYQFLSEVYIDGKLVESAGLPAGFTTRRHEITWHYSLPKGKHSVRFRILNPTEKENLSLWDLIIYSDAPAKR